MSAISILDPQKTASALPFEALVNALEDGFRRGCQAPTRHHHTMTRVGEPDATLLLMPAWSNQEDARQYLGIKLVTVIPGNMERHLPGLVSTYILYDGLTGQQLAIMDGDTITGRRTAATSALAARYLSRPDASRLLVLGSGRVASLIPGAYRAVRPIQDVAIWDINRDSARRLVKTLRGNGFTVEVIDDLEAGVRSADIVSAATLSTAPLVQGAWLRPGTHIDLIGSFRPTMREADDEAIRVSDLYVDTNEALIEAGDLVQPIKARVIEENDVRATLAQLVANEVRGRTNDEQITCFKAVGSALADLAAARLVYETPPNFGELNIPLAPTQQRNIPGST